MREVTKVDFQRAAPVGVTVTHGPAAHEPASLAGGGASGLRGLLRRVHGGAHEQGDAHGEDGPERRFDVFARPPGVPAERIRTQLAPRRGSAHSLALAVCAIAGIGLLAYGGPAPIAVGALLLALSTAIAGWRLGEDRRSALQSEVDERGDDLRRAFSELEIAQAETVRRLSMAVEFRDEDTGAHIERIGRFSRLLAEAVGMSEEFCRRIGHAAPLHDVGKVAIPDAILLKPGSLTAEERAIVETHAEEGHRLLRGSSSSILEMGATIALSHHERWDGGGYPRGITGEEIPLEGRIVAIADVFDALTSHRVYRDAFTVERAVEMMREQSGLHFDPTLLSAFMDVLDSSGADARTRERSNPRTLVAGALEIYTDALRLGDAELAEEAIAQAIEDGIEPSQLQDEVIAPAMRRVEELLKVGELDVEAELRARSITRRVTATMNRYLLARG